MNIYCESALKATSQTHLCVLASISADFSGEEEDFGVLFTLNSKANVKSDVFHSLHVPSAEVVANKLIKKYI